MVKRIYTAPLYNLITDPILRPQLADKKYKELLETRNTFRELYLSKQTPYANLKQATLALEPYKEAHAAAVSEAYNEPPEHFLQPPLGTHVVGNYPSGSKEWLKQRQPSVGGSDVGSIIRIDPVWGDRNFESVKEMKLDTDPQTQDHSGAAGRGDTWEPCLVQILSNIISQEIFVNKDTISDGFCHANLDGFTVNDSGSISKIVECKTSATPGEWGNTHIPPGYVLQVQHYMSFYGVNEGYVVVNIDDSILSVYKVGVNDKISSSPFVEATFGLKEISYSDVKDFVISQVGGWSKTREESLSLGA